MTEIGIVTAHDPADAQGLYDRTAQFPERAAEYFVDGRAGVDRWGRPRKKLWACGTGFGENEHVCPNYLSEACPGERNPGGRVVPSWVMTCDLLCGLCGGGGWIKETGDKGFGAGGTMAYCGHRRDGGMSDSAVAEMGGSLRMDRFLPPGAEPPAGVLLEHVERVLPHPGADEFPIEYFPVVEWGERPWLPKLAEMHGAPYPMLACTMKTALPSTKGRTWRPWKMPKPRTALRDRLGGHQGALLVNGFVKDNVIDDAWDQRHEVMRFCLDSDVDYMVTPQYSNYPEYQPFMWLYNANRIFRWYAECVEMGFKRVVLDLPTNRHPEWLFDEYFGFVERNQVKYVSLSYQQFKARGGVDTRAVWNARTMHARLPKDVAILIFGVGTAPRIMTIAKLFEGRRITFCTAQPRGMAIFYQLLPSGASAPPGMQKDEVFARNVLTMQDITSRVLERVDRPGRPVQVTPTSGRRSTASKRRKR